MQELVRLAEGARDFIHHFFCSDSVAPRHFLVQMAQYSMRVRPGGYMLHSLHEYMSVSCSYCRSPCCGCDTYSTCYNLSKGQTCQSHIPKNVKQMKCLVVQIDGTPDTWTFS